MADTKTVEPGPSGAVKTSQEFENATYRKVTAHILPFLMLCYIVAYLDRVNVGFAKLQMLGDLKFSETVYGLGAGIFFWGYFFFEVPSNIIMHKVGARVWIARIMITWGIISALTVLVRTPIQFYMVRFALGVAEAGFFPGVILYLTYWFPSHRRAKMVGAFMVGIPMAGLIGGPLSGFIMSLTHGLGGWPGWKWMFILEALPAGVVGIACILYLNSRVRDSKWLTEEEKQVVERDIAAEAQQKQVHPSLLALFADPRLWLMAWIYFCCVIGQYALTLWMPTLIKAAGVTSVAKIGLVTMIPYGCCAIAMVVLGASADKRRERRWHVAAPMMIGSVALVLAMIVGGTNIVLAVLLLSIAAAGIIPSAPMFWALPTSFLAGSAAAAGIAAINSVANLAGFVSPAIVGWLKDLTHTNLIPMIVIASVVVAGALTVLALPKAMVNK
jgi:D-galactonate transporter